MNRRKSVAGWLGTAFFSVVSVVYILPIFIVLFNSFKKKSFINLQPFTLPNESTFNGLENYTAAIDQYGFLDAVGWTVFITVGSVLAILLCTSMCAWFITRVNNAATRLIYLLCVFSMVVPFQMVMFTLSLVTDRLGLGTPWGLIIIYLGFGAGLAVFMFCGFVKSIPIEIEEAALIDGCSPLRMFFSVVLPIMQPTYISVGILETMWIWNDFLLPYLTLDIKKYKTISIIIQYMKGSYGRVDMGAIMAALIMAIIPVVIFYLACQKHIIKGVAAARLRGKIEPKIHARSVPPMTIKDIARLSGYGVGTVSRVLNHHPNVSDAARERVMAVVRQYGFEPNSNARHLKSQTLSSVTVLVKGTQNMLFADLLERVQSCCWTAAKRCLWPTWTRTRMR